MFGRRNGRPLDIADIRHLSTASLKREVVHMLREANSKDDYILCRNAIDDILYRITGDTSYRGGRNKGGGGDQQHGQNSNGNQHNRDNRPRRN